MKKIQFFLSLLLFLSVEAFAQGNSEDVFDPPPPDASANSDVGITILMILGVMYALYKLHKKSKGL